MIGKNGNQPVQKRGDAIDQPVWPDELVASQFVGHEVYCIVEQWASGDPTGSYADKAPFVVVGMNDVDSLAPDHAAQQAEKGQV